MAPVDPMSLADPEQRQVWQTARGMQAFSFWDSTNARPTVDVMRAPIVNFDELWAAAAVVTIGGVEVRIASIPHLIRMKEAAGRTQDADRKFKLPLQRAVYFAERNLCRDQACCR